ncbi:hypothetical protein GCM10010517_39020 [Streptosporangium fragile]|uniref:Uncharacterized protein n=1 Tax=Streptosporangium fragile TaxID=46186 RepID=A0ABP6IJ42_9ACTN
MRATATALREHPVQLALGALAQHVEPCVEAGDVLLLPGQLDLTGRRRSIIVGSNGTLRAIVLVVMTNHHLSRSVETIIPPSVITAWLRRPILA